MRKSPTGGRVAAMRFVDPQVLARIGNLELLSRLVVEGFISGLHDAVFRGASVDFAEHRPYSTGDDVRAIDWRVYARSDRLYVKTYDAQTNADVLFALDQSRSMDYSSRGLSKFDFGRFVVGCLCYLAARQRDRTGLAAFDRNVTEMSSLSAGRGEAVLRLLNRLRPTAAGDVCEALRQLAGRLRRRGIVVVVSDFYAEPEAVAAALDELRLRGQDVVAIQIQDPAEQNLGYAGPVLLEDLENAAQLPVEPAAVRSEYQALIAQHQAELRSQLGSRGIEFATFRSDRPLDHLLHHYLGTRAFRGRRRS